MTFRTSLIIIISVMMPVMFSCKSDSSEQVNPEGAVTFLFTNTIDGNPIQRGPMIYVNDANNLYSVELLKYYISNMTFLRSDGSFYKVPENYELVDDSLYGSRIFTTSNIPAGTYSMLRFNVGVDSTKNFAGPQNGDLDPVNGMLWDWITGYLFFKHEGHFVDSTGATDIIRYHYGSLKGLVTIEIPVNLVIEAGGLKHVMIEFNLNKVYRSPNLVNFNGNNFHQSTGPNDQVWLQLIKENFQGSFKITSIH